MKTKKTPGTVTAIQVWTVLSLIGAVASFGGLAYFLVTFGLEDDYLLGITTLLIINAGAEIGISTALLLCSFRVVGCCFCDLPEENNLATLEQIQNILDMLQKTEDQEV